MPKKQEKMLLVPSFPRRTRSPAGALPAASIRQSKPVSSDAPPRRAPTSPLPLCRRARNMEQVSDDGIISLPRGFELAPPVTARKKQCDKRARRSDFQSFPATANCARPCPPLPLSHAHFSPRTRTSAPTTRSKAPSPKLRRNAPFARKRAARRSAEGPPPAASIPEPSENTR